jgi:hypothetical protein
MNIHPVIYEKKIEEVQKVLKPILKPETSRERALVIQIEKARDILRG